MRVENIFRSDARDAADNLEEQRNQKRTHNRNDVFAEKHWHNVRHPQYEIVHFDSLLDEKERAWCFTCLPKFVTINCQSVIYRLLKEMCCFL